MSPLLAFTAMRSRYYEFVRANWWQFVMLLAGPVVAGCSAALFVRAANRMSHSAWNVRSWPAMMNADTGAYVLHGLLLSTVLLVLFNTLAYLKDAWKLKQPIALVPYWLSVGLSVAWASNLVFGWATDGVREMSAQLSVHLNELTAVTIFGLFTFMDALLYLRLKRAPGGTALDSFVRVERETYLLQLFAVDFPVVIGIATATLFVHFALEDSPALGSGPSAAAFETGFVSGTVVMHLAVSQVIFLIIYCRYFYRLFHSKRQT